MAQWENTIVVIAAAEIDARVDALLNQQSPRSAQQGKEYFE